MISTTFSSFPFPLLKGGQTQLSNSESIKATKNVIDFCFQKWNLIFKFSCEIVSLPIDLVFSNCVSFVKRFQSQNFLEFKVLKAHLFSLNFVS